MSFEQLSVAIVAYLTGAITVYAYINRNRYLDLLLASIGLFSFGTSMLLTAIGILPALSFILFRAATILIGATVILLAARIIYGVYRAVRRYMGLD